MKTEAKPKYLDSLVPLRGIICLIVFFYHLFGVSNDYYNNEYLFLFFKYIRYGLYIFFIISGFVITHSFVRKQYKIKHYFKFIAKRIIRIHPTYLVVLAIGVLYFVLRNLFVANNDTFDGIDGFRILAHIFYVVDFTKYTWINIVFWTLAIDFQFYIIYALIFPLIKKHRWILILLMLPSLFLLEMYETVFQHFAVFTIGIVMALFYNKIIALKEFLFFILLSSVVVIYVNGIGVFLYTLPVYLIVFNPLKFPSRFLVFLGKISYSLFLIHPITAFTVINIAHKFPKTTFNKIGFTIIAITLTFIVSYLLYKFVEQPTAKLSKKITYKNES